MFNIVRKYTTAAKSFFVFDAFLRWLIAACVFTFVSVYYGVMMGYFGLVGNAEHPIIAIGVVGMVYMVIAYLGVIAFGEWKSRSSENKFLVEPKHLDPAFFVAELCMGIGLLGTILGMLTALAVFDKVSILPLKQILGSVGAGVSTAQITVFCGLAGAIVVRGFLALTFGAWFRKGE